MTVLAIRRSRVNHDDLLAYCLAKPGAYPDEPWEGDVVAKVGGKIFSFNGDATVGVKCGRDADDAGRAAGALPQRRDRHGLHRPVRLEHGPDRRRDPRRRAVRADRRVVRRGRRGPAEEQAPLSQPAADHGWSESPQFGAHCSRDHLPRDRRHRLHRPAPARPPPRARRTPGCWSWSASSPSAKLDRFGEQVEPLVGDLTQPLLGVSDGDRARLRGQVDHVVHLAALYDMTADDADQRGHQRRGHQRGAACSPRTCEAGLFHHVSSVAVAGDYDGDVHRGHVRRGPAPAVAVPPRRSSRPSSWSASRPRCRGGSTDRRSSSDTRETGEMDKIDGPYYFFPALARLAQLPTWMPLVAPGPRRHQRRPGRLRGGRDGRADASRRPRRPRVPPGRTGAAATARRGQRVQRAAGGPGPFLVVGRSLVGPVSDRCSRRPSRCRAPRSPATSCSTGWPSRRRSCRT